MRFGPPQTKSKEGLAIPATKLNAQEDPAGTVAGGAAPTEAPPSEMRRRALLFLAENAVFVVLVVVVIGAAITYSDFLSFTNIKTLLLENSSLGIIAAGLTFLILTGNFDLSVVPVFVGGIALFCRLADHVPWFIAVAVPMAFGVCAGLINAFVVIRLRVNSFMATLATASIFSGIVQAYLGTNVLQINSTHARLIGTGTVAGIPTPVWILAGVLIVGQIVLAKTPFGRSIMTVGGNREASRLAGIRVGLITTSAFALVGACAALAGALYGAELGTAEASLLSDEGGVVLLAIAMVVVGGTSLFGGEGAVWRTAIGIIIFATLSNVFVGLNLASTSEQIIQGLVVILAVGADGYARTRR